MRHLSRTPAAAKPSAPRRGRAGRCRRLPILWRGAVPPQRGRYRGAGVHARLMSRHPAGAAKVLLPLLRDDHPGTRPPPAGALRPGRARSDGACACGELLRPPAALPPAGDQPPRAREARAPNPVQPDEAGHGIAAAPAGLAGARRPSRRSPACRRHACAGARARLRRNQQRTSLALPARCSWPHRWSPSRPYCRVAVQEQRLGPRPDRSPIHVNKQMPRPKPVAHGSRLNTWRPADCRRRRLDFRHMRKLSLF